MPVILAGAGVKIYLANAAVGQRDVHEVDQDLVLLVRNRRKQ